jgi:hypothetical protein
MAADTQRGALFRAYAPHQHSRVTYAELSSIWYSFSVTQISHTLLGRSGGGSVRDYQQMNRRL